MTTKAIADWIETAVNSALSLTVYKGYPSWGRPGITVPCAALLWVSHDATIRTSTGRPVGTKETVFEIAVYATSEIAMWSYIDTLTAYWTTYATPSISSTRTRLLQGVITRLSENEAPEQARYAFSQQITIQHT